LFSGVFAGEEVGVGDNGLGDTKTADVSTLLEAFLNLFPRSTCLINEAVL
jgi:hypothetical protein